MAEVNKEELILINVNSEKMDSSVNNLSCEKTANLLSVNVAEVDNNDTLESEATKVHDPKSEATIETAVIGDVEADKKTAVEEIKSTVQEKSEEKEPEKSDFDKEPNLKSEPYVKLQFRDAEAYEEFSEILLKLLTTMGFTFKEEQLNFRIDFFETDSLTNCPDLEKLKISKKKKRKRKKSKDESDGFFVLDTTPSLSTQREKVLKYESKFNIQNAIEKNNENTSDTNSPISAANSCFNCNENHNLKDCPLPRDNAKINQARLKFRNLPKNGRYHLEDDQKYSHLKPGQLTDNLRKALGLHRDQLPDYIYRMRRLGYPPGWLEEAQVVHSDLTVYDFDGKNVITNKKRKPFVDPEKIVDYPGFNVPLVKGFKDEYRDFGVPPYSDKFSKNVMLQHIKKLEEREQDNLDVEDMELESIMSEKDVTPLKCVSDSLSGKEIDSPSLTELESKKNQLLAELNDSTNGSATSAITAGEISSEDNKTVTSKEKEVTVERDTTKITTITSMSENGKIKNITEETFEESTETIFSETMGMCSVSSVTSDKMVNLSQTESVETLQTESMIGSQTESMGGSQTESMISSQIETASSSQTETISSSQTETVSSSETETLSSCSEFMDTSESSDPSSSTLIRTIAFGTPILKTASPYSRLPKPENFSKNISDVINFENLPNSTGKYEQMAEVLQKVRKTLKNLHEKNS